MPKVEVQARRNGDEVAFSLREGGRRWQANGRAQQALRRLKALRGDTVALADGAPSALTARADHGIVAVVEPNGDLLPVLPNYLSGKLPYPIRSARSGARPGFYAAVPAQHQDPAIAELLVELSAPFDQPSALAREIAMVRAHHRLPQEPVAREDEQEGYRACFAQGLASGERQDLRARLIYTIDGPDTKDIDDAIDVEDRGDGHYVLGVHIADVTALVAAGSRRDLDAQERATSHYLADTVIHMLPAILSEQFCSLKPGEDRLAFSVFVDIALNDDGSLAEVGRAQFFRSIIRSQHRLTYDDVQAVIQRRDGSLEGKPDALVRSLDLAWKLGQALQATYATGEYDEQPKYEEQASGELTRRARARAEADRLVEALMVRANLLTGEKLALALRLSQSRAVVAFRRQESPSRDALEKLNQRLRGAGLVSELELDELVDEVVPPDFDGEREVDAYYSSHVLDALLEKIDHRNPYARLTLDALMVDEQGRRLFRAATVSSNVSDTYHHSMRVRRYAWFTSPIRRYPDMINHRALAATLMGQAAEAPRARVEAVSSSIANAKFAQRDLEHRLTMRWLAQQLAPLGALRCVVKSFRFAHGRGFVVETRLQHEGLPRLDLPLLFRGVRASCREDWLQCQIVRATEQLSLMVGDEIECLLVDGLAVMAPDLGVLEVLQLAGVETRAAETC
jgi:VacB/RNase II family 3'-5' exoribonuclease